MPQLMSISQRRYQYRQSKDSYPEFGQTPPPIAALWADLLVIEQCSQPEILINAWQTTPSVQYDFSLGRDKIVVRSSVLEDRVHGFTLDVVRPVMRARVLVASTVVRLAEACSGGLSLKGLYARVLRRVPAADAQMRLYSRVADAVGGDVGAFEGVCFDYAAALDYLEFYDGAEVPAVERGLLPAGVGDVSFTSDLSGLVDVRRSEKAAEFRKSALFRGLM